MDPQEIQGILDAMENRKEKPKPKLAFEVGDKVKIKEGPFENYEGEVLEVNPEKGFLTVQVNIFRRSTPVELEFWMVERI
jgi:transcriptional antiterminator NusG